VLRAVKVFGRVLVLGAVAAADVPALHAQAKVHPLVAELETLFTSARARPYRAHVIEMVTSLHAPDMKRGAAKASAAEPTSQRLVACSAR
jgi:hypothetical protein